MSQASKLDQLKRDLNVIVRKRSEEPVHPKQNRGRAATSPEQIPAPGWKDILVRTWGKVSESNIFLVAGGVTYSVVLALFPALAALVALYGLVADPAQIESQVAAMSRVLPQQSADMIGSELHDLISASNGSLSVSAIVGLLFALWSASRGMSGLITAIDIAYQQKETRNFFKFNLIAVLLTLGMLIGGTIIIALVAVLPAALQFIGLGGVTKWLLLILEWPLLIVVVMVGLAMLYRYAPDRETPRWRWVSPGALGATILWLLGSLAFSIYVSHFNSYNKTYGSLGGVVILLTWLYLSAFVALLGAVINAESERQTVADSTTGQSKPLGNRRAYAADTVGNAQS